MLGGGTFTAQNKVLPGSYINFVSAQNASPELSDRGIVAVPMQLDWGQEGSIFAVELADLQTNAVKLFGYSYSDAKLKDIREMFRNARRVYIYRLDGAGVKAAATLGALTATAKYGGTRGNSLKIVIVVNASDGAKFDVMTYLGTDKVDTQTVANIAGLVANDFVTFNASGVLAVNAGVTLAGGTNKAVAGADYTTFLNLSESVSFNVMVCPVTDSTTQDLFVAHVKRRRDDNGVKFQTIIYQKAADYEGVISVENTVSDAGGANAASLVYWVGGAEAGCTVNASNTNKLYDGEYTVNTTYTQAQLEANIKAGKLMLHKVGDSVRILTDINSLMTTSVNKGADFQSNQTIRVIDQIANDIAVIFNTGYLGQSPNDSAGRTSLWSDIVSHHKQLERLRAIENFSSSDVVVTAGATKRAVVVQDVVDIVNTMEVLYMTVTIE